MPRKKNAVANGNHRRFSADPCNLDPFSPRPLRREKNPEVKKPIADSSAPAISIILIMDELGARTVRQIPKGVLRNMDAYNFQDEKGVFMITKRGSRFHEVMPEVIADDLHALEANLPLYEEREYGNKVNQKKRWTHRASGRIIREMDWALSAQVLSLSYFERIIVDEHEVLEEMFAEEAAA